MQHTECIRYQSDQVKVNPFCNQSYFYLFIFFLINITTAGIYTSHWWFIPKYEHISCFNWAALSFSCENQTLCSTNKREVETIPKLWSHSHHIQGHRKDLTLHRLLYSPSCLGHLTLLFHIQPSPLKEKNTGEKETKLVYTSFTMTEVSCTVECWLTIHGWQMETERGVMRKRASIQAGSMGWALWLHLTHGQAAVIQRSP